MRKVIKISSLAVVIIVMTAVTVGNAASINQDSTSDKTKISVKGSAGDKNIELKAKTITFDFPNTQLKVFAQFVAKLCSKTLIGEDLLKGNINIKSQKKMNLQQVMKVFRAVLNSQGLEYAETGSYIEIILISDSIVKVYDINYLKSADIAKSLTQMFRMSLELVISLKTFKLLLLMKQIR